jgi:MFS family permease
MLEESSPLSSFLTERSEGITMALNQSRSRRDTWRSPSRQRPFLGSPSRSNTAILYGFVFILYLSTLATTATAASASAASTAKTSTAPTYSIHDAILRLSGGEAGGASASASAAVGATTTPRQRAVGKLANKLKMPAISKAKAIKQSQLVVKVEDKEKLQVVSATATATTTPQENKEDPRMKVLIRLLFLMYYGSLGSIMPYLPVYYHHLGHGGQIIGLLGAVKPFTTFLVAPVWGLIADQTQNPFLILQVTFIVSLLGQLLVSFRTDASFIMFMVFLTALFNAPVKSLIDSMVMDHIQPESYGRLRLWGQMGFGVGSSLVGLALSKSKHISWPETTTFTLNFEKTLERYPTALQHAVKYADKCWQSLTGYKLLFFTYAALSIPTWLCIQAFCRLDREREVKKAAAAAAVTSAKKKKKTGGGARIGEGLRLLLHDSDALLFFFLVFVVGISSGVIENFAYVRMREVGGTGKEMGLSRLVSSCAGAPMFWFSGPLTEALGADRVIVFSLLSYVARFIMYALMRNPYHGLPAEALRGVTFAAFWSTCTIYAFRVSPPGLHATMLMILNAMYGGLGQSLGAIIGGKMQHRYGTVKTFLYAAAVDFVFVCAVIAYLNIRKDSSFKDPKPIVAKEKSGTS